MKPGAEEKSKMLWLGWMIRYHITQASNDYLSTGVRPNSVTLRYPAEGFDLLAHATSTAKHQLKDIPRKYTRKNPKHIDTKWFPTPRDITVILSAVGARLAFLTMKIPNVELYGICWGSPVLDDYSFRLEIPKSRKDTLKELEPYRFSHKGWGDFP